MKSSFQCDCRANYSSPHMLSGPEALAAVRGILTSYRVDPARIELLRTALKCYEGTQMYHNFTTGKHPTDANARRYVISFTCGEPFVDPASDAEWVLLSVVGQSFLLNQIRKMIGLASEVATGHVPVSMMKDALSKQKVRVLNMYKTMIFANLQKMLNFHAAYCH
jgi:tRNA pseudouridine38-40 synthase